MAKPKDFKKKSIKAAKKGDFQGAIQILKTGLNEFQDDVSLLVDLGYALKENGDLEGAKDIFKSAKEKEGKSGAEVCTGLVSVLGHLGAWEEAIPVALEGKEKFPRNVDVLFNLGVVAFQLKEKDPDMLPVAGSAPLLAYALVDKDKICRISMFIGKYWSSLEKAGMEVEPGTVKSYVTTAATADPKEAKMWSNLSLSDPKWILETGNNYMKKK